MSEGKETGRGIGTGRGSGSGSGSGSDTAGKSGLGGVLQRQAGIVTKAQAMSRGMTYKAVRSRVDGGRWQRVHRGVFAAFGGPLPWESHLWAAVLLGGPGAVLSHQTAAELDGLLGPGAREPYTPPARFDDGGRARVIHVTVPADRIVRSAPAAEAPRLVFHRCARVAEIGHPARLPPRTRIEETVIDLAQRASDLDRAVGWLAAGCQCRLTTPDRLLAAMARRPRLRRRRELREALGEVASGAETLLEIRYARRVERAHGLPPGRRQVRRLRHGLVRYDDTEYEGYGVVVELDGGVAHPEWDRARDRGRDNISVELGLVPLRYGWGDVSERPCRTAAQVARALASRGWQGRPRPCGDPACAVGEM